MGRHGQGGGDRHRFNHLPFDLQLVGVLGGIGGWTVKAVVVLFDCLGLAVWWQAGRHIGSALKFGHSRIAFARFPYRLREPVIIRWQPGAAFAR